MGVIGGYMMGVTNGEGIYNQPVSQKKSSKIEVSLETFFANEVLANWLELKLKLLIFSLAFIVNRSLTYDRIFVLIVCPPQTKFWR